VRKHVEQHFRIGVGIHLSTVLREYFTAQLFGVDQVAVVRQGNAVGRVDVERLGLVRAFRTGGGIAAMADAHAPAEQVHVLLAEHIFDQAVALVHA